MKQTLLLFMFIALTCTANAQEVLTEGTITYSVSIGPVAGGATFTEHAGTYTITIKGKQVRKELSMSSGYQNVQIINANTGTIYALQSTGGQKYAIQLQWTDIAEKQKPYEHFTVSEPSGSSTIAGWPCEKATVRYKDGTSSVIYYTTSLKTSDSMLFDRFPGIQSIPLSFEYRNEEGITMHFSAEKLEVGPVESAAFRVPSEYKVISNAEYRKVKR